MRVVRKLLKYLFFLLFLPKLTLMIIFSGHKFEELLLKGVNYVFWLLIDGVLGQRDVKCVFIPRNRPVFVPDNILPASWALHLVFERLLAQPLKMLAEQIGKSVRLE
jgi:hypothetical protein